MVIRVVVHKEVLYAMFLPWSQIWACQGGANREVIEDAIITV